MPDIPGFDPNDYRKRVLAAVLARGGPEASDPFELYDLPPDPDLDDAAVAARVAEVWGAWQRQRDHPKYRVLVATLVDRHDVLSAEVLDAGRRRTAAARVRAQREQRDAARYELLDAAVTRLVARHRGIPADKVDGLHEIGALGGLSRDEVTTRLRRHRVVTAAPAGPGVAPERRRQVRALLDEFGRLTDAAAPATLLALLDAGPGSGPEEIAARAAAWRSRARELPPARLRTVVDELLVHVAELLEPGRAAVEAYLDAVAVDVGEHLTPRVRAAVLVEDRLVAEDHAHLLDEAVARGLDRPRAVALLAAIAAELGTTIETGGARAPARIPEWEERLRAARAALRAGRPREAAGLVAEARRAEEAQRATGPDGRTAVRAVAEEIDAVLADAGRRWRAVRDATAARRWVEVRDHLEHLARTAADVPDRDRAELPADLLDRARREVADADAALAAAAAGPPAGRATALAAVLERCPGHPAAQAALAALPLAGPGWVRAARDGHGDVLVVWESPPAGAEAVVYRVSRIGPDGRRQVVGRVTDTSVLDGGAPPGVTPPVYAVEALAGGRASVPTRSDTPAADTPAADVPAADVPAAHTPPEPPPPSAPEQVRARREADGTVTVSWTGPAGAEFRVRCRRPDGGWRVVARTRATSVSDGSAPPGPLPEYTVSAAVGGVRSASTSTA